MDLLSKVPLQPLIKKNLSVIVQESLNDYINKLLETGTTKLPSEIELANILNVSRTTIRQALSELEYKGTIMRIHGKGTFINPNLKQIKLSLLSGHNYYELIQKSGFTPKVELIHYDIIEASPIQSAHLMLKEESKIYSISKMYYSDSHPSIFCIDYIPTLYFSAVTLSREDFCQYPFELLRKKAGIICTHDSVSISASSPSSLSAYTMGSNIMETDSLLVFDSINYGQNGKPISLSKSYFNTNYIKFNINRTIR